MTPDRDAIRKRCEAATKPPWSMTRSVVFGAALWGGDRSCLFRIESDIERSTVSDADPVSQWEKDARFVYHAREDVPALLAEVERLEREAQATEATVTALRNRCLLYNEATTILLECDHGDGTVCGCRDRAMERLVTLLPHRKKAMDDDNNDRR